MTEVPDYSKFKDSNEDTIGGNMMASLVALADIQEAAESEVERLKLLLEEATANVRRMSEFEIPKLLDGLEGKINLPDGRTITVQEKIRTSVSGDRKPRAMQWLEDNGHGAIVKRRMTIDLSKDQEELAEKIRDALEALDEAVLFKEDKNVAWQTLDAFVKEQLTDGVDIPLELFGVYHQKIAKIKR